MKPFTTENRWTETIYYTMHKMLVYVSDHISEGNITPQKHQRVEVQE